MQTKSKRTPTHFTRDHQRYARSKVSSDACARNGRLGAQATIAKYGQRFLFERWRAWKLENPSKPEMILIGILSTLRIRFLREWQIGETFFTVDFYLPTLNKGIEFHGRVHQALEQEQRKARDVKKLELLERIGVDTLWLDQTDLESVPALIAKIINFTKQHEDIE